MSLINFAKIVLLGFVGLLMYTELLMKYGTGVFNLIFDVAGGDGNIIFFIFSGIVLSAFGVFWVWSAKAQQRRGTMQKQGRSEHVPVWQGADSQQQERQD